MSTIVVLTDVSLILVSAMTGDDGVQIVLRFAEGTEVALPLTEAPSRHNQRLLLSESARLIRLVNNTAT